MSRIDTPGSSRERTRKAIFDATIAELARHGTAITLRDIAEAAGILKSGLLHHFPSKEVLIKSVAIDFLERFHSAVLANVDLSENRPGKLLRAYVRTLCAPSQQDLADYHMFAAICDALSDTPEVAALIDEDNAGWRRQLLADGLDPATVLVVRYAAEGIATASSYDEYAKSTGLKLMLPALLELTERG